MLLRCGDDSFRQIARHGFGEGRALAVQEAGIDRRGDELRVLENLQQERDVGANAEDGVFAQGRNGAAARSFCSPSRGPTSTIVTFDGTCITRSRGG